MADTDFLSFLVDETFKLQKDGEGKLSSLETKLSDYGLEFFRGEFVPQIQMLRFQTNFGLLDVPVNWSLFSPDYQGQDSVLLDSENDVDQFFTVLKSCWGQDLEKALIFHADGFSYLVKLRVGDELHLHDILHPQEWLKSA